MNESIEIIRQSFENWYNTSLRSNINAVVSYSDEQTLLIKAYHKVTIKMIVVGIQDNLSFVVPITEVSEHYNHGVTSEEEAKRAATTKFVERILIYCQSKGKSN